MDILILGGTLFVGRHLVEALSTRGHAVTLFNRGRTGAELFPEVERLHGDRDGGLDALAGRRWDAVIDTSGYVPRVVRQSAGLLADAVGLYVFVSSASVYADLQVGHNDETLPVRTVDDEASEDVARNYGALKALCERAVEQVMPGRVLNVRPGFIVGPHDPTGRFAYWVDRIADGGLVLAPGRPERRVQLIDVRDLAKWIVAMIEAARPGIYNATGPDRVLTMGELLDTCRQVGGGETEFEWVDEAFLTANEVAPFSDLPFWLPDDENGLLSLAVDKAIDAGLRFRPLEATVADTRRWLAEERDAPLARPARLASGASTRPGLDTQWEMELLDVWHKTLRPSPA